MNLRAAPALFSLLAVACSHNVQLPPSRPLALEAPTPIPAGQTRGRFVVANHGTLFSGEYPSANLRLRRGLSPSLEASLDAAVISPANAESADLNGYLARLGGKLNPSGGVNFALTGGLGGGFSPAVGSMVSADGGVVIGYDNRYVVPFVSLSTYMSAPIEAKPIRTGSEPEDLDTPTLTGGTGLTVGFEIIRESFTISTGFGFTEVRDEDGSEMFMSVGAAIELALD